MARDLSNTTGFSKDRYLEIEILANMLIFMTGLKTRQEIKAKTFVKTIKLPTRHRTPISTKPGTRLSPISHI